MDGDGKGTTRWLIVGSALVAVVLAGASAVVPADSYVGRSMLYAGRVVLAFAAVGCMVAAMIRQYRRGPARLVVRDGAFVVPANQVFGLFVVGQLLLVGGLGGFTVDLWAHGVSSDAPSFVDDLFAVVMSVLVVPLVLVVVLLTARVFRNRPVLTLTPDALVVRDPAGVRTFPWEALVPWSDVRGQDLRTMRLPVARPELVVRRGLRGWGSRVALGFADVHPWFFADAARFYVLRPDRRAGIGTVEEYDRLLADLGVRVHA